MATRQDYDLIAAAVRKTKQDRPTRAIDASYDTGIVKTALAIAEALGKQNPGFNKETFLKACVFGAAQEQPEDGKPKVLVTVFGGCAEILSRGEVDTKLLDWDDINCGKELTEEDKEWIRLFGLSDK